MALWEEGSISELVKEAETIQQQLTSSHKVLDDGSLAKRFATMVFNNNFKGAMSLVMDKGKGGILKLHESTKQEMKSKHPKPEPLHTEALITGDMPTDLHPIFFSALNGDLIKRCTLRTRGGAGVSQQEDTLWQKMVTAFKDTSTSLQRRCGARWASEFVDPAGLDALLANRRAATSGCWRNIAPNVGKAIMNPSIQ